MRLSESKRGGSPPRRYFVPYFVLEVGLLITALFSYYIWKTAEARDLARFNTSAQELTTYVSGRPRLYNEVLLAGTGFFAVNPSITPSQFHNFIERLELADQFPGSQGIGFLARVKQDRKDFFQTTVRQRGLKDFTLWPDQNQDEYYPVVYFEPLDGHSPVDVGFDMQTDPVRRAAMETARDTGQPAATARVMLTRENDENKEPGFLIYAPIYENDRKPTSVAERREALSGFVYSQFRASDFIQSVLAIKDTSDIDLHFYDGAQPSSEALLYDTAATANNHGAEPARFTTSSTVEVAGRPWTLAFASRPGFVSAANRKSLHTPALAGVLISLLLFVLTRSQVKARAEAERSAAELGLSEATVRKTLTDRERAEEALRESEERYRDLVENANDIVFMLDLKGNMTSVNKAVESITGYSQAEVVRMNMSEFLTPGSADSARLMTERKLGGEERTNYEVEVRTKDGRLVTLEISSRLVIHQGQPVGVQGVARDITTRRQAEEGLRQADQRALSEYERLLEKLARLAQTLGTARDLDVIFEGLKQFTLASVPCDGLFVSLYDPMRDVRTACYGWGDGEYIDTSKLPPMPVNFTGPNSRAVRTNQVIITNDYMSVSRGHPAVLVGPDNGLRPQSSLSAPMSVMGRIIGTIEVQSYENAAYRDEHATAMRMAANLTAVAIENVRLLEWESTARASAEESNRLKDEFLATVSHELRTPLTAILGWSRMLQSGSLESETAIRAVDSIKRNAKAQAQIIDDILDVSRIITGHLYLELHPIELAPVLDSAINVVRPTAEAKGIQIEVDLGPEPAAVPGDTNRLQQVFWNLLSNAVKFTPAGGKVSVQLRQVDSQVQIEVTDTGQGITAEFLPFVFDRFRQQDSTSTRQHGGLGLGLAIARHLVEIHGGNISARSRGAGAGATFTVRLPLLGSLVERPEEVITTTEIDADEESQERLRSQQILSGLRILLVDDDKDTLELLSAALTQRSATVTAVSSVAAAVDWIKSCRPDVLISDIAMPGEDGHELMRQVLALDVVPRIPAIAITAYAKEEDKERALAAGYQRYLSKPVELRDFISTVAEVSVTIVSSR
ncbi:MAG TPA: CHASE domain-containing protein [Pyrinomonadaceae bacterium]|jgi:PAS domain S-box-containing protein|nr:CHASE domain-containing protein [Pyrinomonadaceae bacterium]